MKYIYWITDGKSGCGEYLTEEEAKDALKRMKEDNIIRNPEKQVVARFTAAQCHCGRWTRKDILEGLSECLSCDSIRYDL